MDVTLERITPKSAGRTPAAAPVQETPVEQPASSKADDDDLDIPPFLRR